MYNTSDTNFDPNTAFGGNWELLLNIDGGQLLAYGNCSATPTGYAVSGNTYVYFSQLLNYNSDAITSCKNLTSANILSMVDGKWRIHSNGSVSYIKLYLQTGGLGEANGLWFQHYGTPPNGVHFTGLQKDNDALISGYVDHGDRYFSGETILTYAVSTSADITFDLNPRVCPYAKPMRFGTGGLPTRLGIEVYGNIQKQYTWKRVS